MALLESAPEPLTYLLPLAAVVTDDRAVVWVRGENDISTVAAMSVSIARAITVNDADLVIDLSDVEFMDAATIGVIMRTREFLRLQSRSVVLRAPSRCASRVLGLCGLGVALPM